MKIKPSILLIVLSITYVIGSFFLSKPILENCELYNENILNQIDILDIESRLLSGKEWGYAIFNEANNEVIDSAMEALDAANSYYKIAVNNTAYILIISLIYFACIFFFYFKKNLFRESIVICLSIIGLVTLYLGVTAPILEIVAYSTDLEIPLILSLKDVLSITDLSINTLSSMSSQWVSDWFDFKIPKIDLESLAENQDIEMTAHFHGNIYYYYQNKSAMSLITTLLKQNNYVVGLTLLSFSIIIPIFKLLFTMLICSFSYFKRNKTLIIITKIIGKWSMADVFVAACFLSFLSFNNMSNQIETESNVLLGLYFFLAYVIISLTSSSLLTWAIKPSK